MDLVNANSKNPQVIKAIAFFIHSIKVESKKNLSTKILSSYLTKSKEKKKKGI